VELISAPGLNVMYGDAKGNAWWASGKYTNTRKVDTHFILMVPPEKMILRNIFSKILRQ
jgi:penicillin amidase